MLSKIEIHDALRAEGLWDAFAKRRDELKRRFKKPGTTKAAALERAWEVAAGEEPFRQHLEPLEAEAAVGQPVASENPAETDESELDDDDNGQPADVEAVLSGADVSPSMAADLAWAYEALGNPQAAGPPPSNGAKALVAWGKTSRNKFFELCSRVLVDPAAYREQLAQERIQRDTELRIDQIDRMLAAQRDKVLQEGQRGNCGRP